MRNNREISTKFIQFLLISAILYGVQGVRAVSLGITGLDTSNSVPSARFAHSMVYDELNHQVILFGGNTENNRGFDLSDTWIFNCTSNTWVELHLSVKPPSRMGHSMVYDSINQQVILFGGWNPDTWIFDIQSKVWTEVAKDSRPEARRSVGMYFDPVNEKIVLFGGYLNNDDHANDTWIFDPANNTWREVFPAFSPAARYGHSLVYDSVNQQGLLFGGRVTALQNDTWEYNYTNNSWTLFHHTYPPKARYWHSAAFDENQGQMVAFGGDDDGGQERNDTWTFNPQTDHWTEIFPETAPIRRSNHAMVYDSQNQRIILFGGLGNSYTDSYEDTWAYDSVNSNWLVLHEPTTTPTTTPAASPFLEFFTSIFTLSLLAIFVLRRQRNLSPGLRKKI